LNRYVRWMNEWAYQRDGFVRRWRSQRMQQMLQRLGLPAKARVIDLGGTEYLWSLFDHDFHVTLVNLPGARVTASDPARFALLEGDACDLGAQVADGGFDLAFSNSVIEHVGDEARQAAFAREARRVGRAYWVQTPSPAFPIEAHTGVPWYFRLPPSVQARLLARWRERAPDWAWAVEHTTVIPLARMRALFPDGHVFVERKLGFEKSYALYRPY